MAIQQKLGLSTRLSQRLILTPSLQQAIKLLPLTTLELAEVLEQEVMENPLLEEVPQEQPSAEEIAQEEAKTEREDILKEIDVEKFFEDYLDDGDHRRTRSAEIPELPPIENTLTEQPDLYDHLMWQLHMSVSDEFALEIGDAIIQNLDADGLLRASRGRDREPRPLPDGRGPEGADPRPGSRPRGGGRARPHGVPAPAAPATWAWKARPPT